MNEPLSDLLELPPAAVALDASLAEAARTLYGTGVAAVAVLDGERVKGMVAEDELLRAIFPGYLSDLTHTAFVENDSWLESHLSDAASRPVREIMRTAETVELPASALDIAQRFLHTDASALIAVRDGAFVGVIDQTRFCKATLRRYGWQL